MAKKENGSNGAGSHVEASPLPTITKEIAGVEIALPFRVFVVEGVIQPSDKAELIARIASEAIVRQYKNNKDAAFKAWQKKVEAKDEKAGDNPCTAEALVSGFAEYWPDVGEGGLTTTERMRREACLKAIRKAINEHNEHVVAHKTGLDIGGRKTFGDVIRKVPTGDDREATIDAILGTTNTGWVERIQVELDALKAEKASEKPKGTEASVVKVSDLSF